MRGAILLDELSSNGPKGYPVVLGAGLTGLAISRALSAARIRHVLAGNPPTETPRLGESLNADGSLEIVQQFPDLKKYVFEKRQQVLFFGEHALSFDFLNPDSDRIYQSLTGYPAKIRLLHVDRLGFDGALFESAVASEHCVYTEGRATRIDYDRVSDRILGVRLNTGTTVVPTYVFDATNDARFVARATGVRCNVIGKRRRVVFAHYRTAEAQPDTSLPWLRATSGCVANGVGRIR